MAEPVSHGEERLRWLTCHVHTEVAVYTNSVLQVVLILASLVQAQP